MIAYHRWIAATVFLLALMTSGHAQQANSEIDASLPTPANEQQGADSESKDPTADLDQLLEMADRDLSELQQVRVQAGRDRTPEQFATAPSLKTEVSTVTRQRSTVGQSPAAVSVITSEMIRRSGAVNVPELLRMVPGVQVARIDANKWAISIRGFNNRFANKLLVQIDGRSVYTPLFGGTFWDVQDLPLVDIERIEIVRGPGAAVWGANAVNGVINIITKKSSETTGLYVHGGAGTVERGFTTLQYGKQVTDALSYRVYGKWFDRDTAYDPTQTTHDDWRQGRGGFRPDWEPDEIDHISVQGDFYEGVAGQRSVYPTLSNTSFLRFLEEDARVNGQNLLFRWTRNTSEDSDWKLRMYYNRTERSLDGIGFSENRNTYDIDFERGQKLGDFQRLVWGVRYWNAADEIASGEFSISYRPPARRIDGISYFVQDELQLTDSTFLTLGSKFFHNDFTNFEFQPTARFLWTPSDRQSAWASFSRAVRIPTRSADDLQLIQTPLPLGVVVFPVLRGQRDIESEDLFAYECGFRAQPNCWFSWDLATFYHEYDDLIVPSVQPFMFDPNIGATTLPIEFRNEGDGYTYGFEWASHVKMIEGWEMHAAYSLLRMRLFPDPAEEGSSPRNQLYLQSSWNLLHNLELDAVWRYVDSLPNESVPSYNVMDLRLAWRPSADIEWGVVGRNLLDRAHPEFGDDLLTGVFATEVQREVYTYFTLRR